ncbi:peptide ABC transporter substrate-binding protein [Pelosinus sp. sgz500959]|uniref:peptide ABC transporter substrate-binding protein n=1 Tax=Pelosinus sp. sgz500959 TaxID=3242472 RepID=UPI003672B1DE
MQHIKKQKLIKTIIFGCKNSLLLCSMLIMILLVGGCSSNSLQSPAKREIKQGGQLVYGSLQEPDTLNPLLSDLVSTAEVSSLIFSGLVTMNDKGEWIPDLATEVPTLQNGGISRDGLTITYKLRSGVTWHDGKVFNADDVKFTWQTIMNSKVNVVSREGYDKIKAIDTPDPYTVIIRFKEYYPSHLALFNAILPKHILEVAGDINKTPFNRSPIGTGPFKFKEWRLAEAVVLEGNAAYFRGKTNLNTIVYKVIPDSNIMLIQLKAGEVDVVANIPFAQLDQVKDIDGIEAVITPNMIWEHLDFNLDNALFQDGRVRQAIALGIDKQGLVANVLKNAGSPAAGDQSTLSWAYNPGIKQETRDVNAARELLVQAGWKLGDGGIFTKDGSKLAFSLAFPTGNRSREIAASVIVQQLKEIGVAVELRPVDEKVFFAEVLKNRGFQTALYAWVAGIEPNSLNLWHSKKIPSRTNGYDGQNYSGWRNPEIDALTEQGARLIDVEGRKQIYYRIQDLIVQEHPVIPLYFRSNIDAVRKTVANYHSNPTPAGNLWNAWQWGLMSK